MTIPSTLVAVFCFIFVLLAVSLLIVLFLMRNVRKKAKSYSLFADNLSEFMVILSMDGNLIDAKPGFCTDILFKKISEERNFKNILSAQDYSRLVEYIQGLSSYPDIPFIFSFCTEQGLLWYELRAYVQNKMERGCTVLFIKNITKDVVSKNQRDDLKQKLDMLLQNTGDFLWMMDVDTRSFTILTPLMDDEGRAIPQSVGVHDFRTMMSALDYENFERKLNSRIVDFRATGNDSDQNGGISLRLLRPDGSSCWYLFGGHLAMVEGTKMVFRGTARRMELLQDNPVLEDGVDSGVLLSSALSFPDIRVAWVDRSYKVAGCNQAFALAFGQESTKKIEGCRLLDVMHPKYFYFFHKFFVEAFEKRRTVSWKGCFVKSDFLVWLNIVPIKNLDGNMDKLLLVYMPLKEEDFS